MGHREVPGQLGWESCAFGPQSRRPQGGHRAGPQARPIELEDCGKKQPLQHRTKASWVAALPGDLNTMAGEGEPWEDGAADGRGPPILLGLRCLCPEGRGGGVLQARAGG